MYSPLYYMLKLDKKGYIPIKFLLLITQKELKTL